VKTGAKLDVLVIAHDKIEETVACIQTLYAHTPTPFHLIVVDDSKDLTPLYMRDFINQFSDKHEITHVYSKVPYKCGNQIFNKALEHCRTPFMATVMNSVRVEPEWEVGPLQILMADPKVGYVGSKCLFYHNGLIECAGIKMVKWLPTDIGRDEPGHRIALAFDVEATQWAFGTLRVEAGKSAKFDETSFNGFRGWDDIDNCFVLKKAGWKIVECGHSVGYHKPRLTRGNNSPESQEENRQNAHAFFKRWGFWEEFIKTNPDGKNVHSLRIDGHEVYAR